MNEDTNSWPKDWKQKSRFAQHLVEDNHNMSYINNLHFFEKWNVLNTLEKFETYKAFKNKKFSFMKWETQFKITRPLQNIDHNAKSAVSNTNANNTNI